MATILPQQVLVQLSTVLQLLTRLIQPSKVMTPPQHTDPKTLSEASNQQQTTPHNIFMHRAEADNTGRYLMETSLVVSLSPVSLRIKEEITAGEYIVFLTLLPKAMLLGSSDPESPK